MLDKLEEKMFNNIGKKIKSYAKWVCFCGIGASVIGGLRVLTEAGDAGEFVICLIIAIIIIAVGGFVSWVSSFTVYGFGQMVDNSDKLVELKELESINKFKPEAPAQEAPAPEAPKAE